MQQDNSEQAKFWDGDAGGVWTDAQAQMDALLKPLSDVAVARAAAHAGERVIDVGCGCGDTSLALAAAGAAVWGIDLSAAMLERARERAEGAGELVFTQTDAALQAFTPDHQLLFSRFGVMFFADPVAAFANLRTALSPDGRLVFLCWQKPRDNPWLSIAGAAAQPFMPEPAEPVDPLAPGPFAFADADRVREILHAAGFGNVNIESVQRTLNLAPDLDQAIDFQMRIGPLARALAELDEATLAQAIAAVREALAPHVGPGGLALGSATWLVSATRD